MRAAAAQALLLIKIKAPLPPRVNQTSVPSSWDSSSNFTPITCCWFPSKPINFSAPRYSHFHYYPEPEPQEIGFKRKENHDDNNNNILESRHHHYHLFKSAPTNKKEGEQGPQNYISSKQNGRIGYESQSSRDDASNFDFVSQFNNSSSSGKKSGKEEEGKPTMAEEEEEEEAASSDMERPRPEDTGGPVVCRELGMGTTGRKQIMKRSTMIAKQVISIQSAITLGFVSQLWVDTNAWVVLFVEVKPNLLSGELERFFLDDIAKVGDVVLIEDENVMENDFKLVGLETLVGYTVVTPGRRNIGKVRGYTFNINSGAVESLELDSFGISIIPSSLVGERCFSLLYQNLQTIVYFIRFFTLLTELRLHHLVSTYALLVEDVLEVLPDTIVVHESAASRIQRLTKGFWGATGYMPDSVDEYEKYSDYGASRKRNLSSGKFPGGGVEPADDWDLPMDYL